MSKVIIYPDFYNDEERALFKRNYSNWNEINKLCNESVELNYSDFKTYFLFKEQRDEDGFRNFMELKNKVNSRWGKFKDYFVYDKTNKKFSSQYDNNRGQVDMSEALGVAGSLAVISKLHELTDADWRSIPITNKKRTPDYEIESKDGNRQITHKANTNNIKIYVESKGSIKPNNTFENIVDYHYKSIKEKKEGIVSSAKSKYYGVITIASPDRNLKALLVDPPIFDSEENIEKEKLLSRLNYYHNILKILMPRLSITINLAHRIRILNRIKNYKELDKIHLEDKQYDSLTSFSAYSHSLNETIIGKSFFLNKKEVLFYGLRVELLSLLAEQNFENILSYKNTKEFSDKTLVLNFRQRDIVNQNSRFFENIIRQRELSGRYNSSIRFRSFSDVSVSSSGFSFSICDIDQLELI